MYLFMWVIKKIKKLKKHGATREIRHSNRAASPIFEKRASPSSS